MLNQHLSCQELSPVSFPGPPILPFCHVSRHLIQTQKVLFSMSLRHTRRKLAPMSTHLHQYDTIRVLHNATEFTKQKKSIDGAEIGVESKIYTPSLLKRLSRGFVAGRLCVSHRRRGAHDTSAISDDRG